MNEFQTKLLTVLELLNFKFQIEQGKGRSVPITIRIEKDESKRRGLDQWEDVNGILPSLIQDRVITGKRYEIPHHYIDVDLPEDFEERYQAKRGLLNGLVVDENGGKSKLVEILDLGRRVHVKLGDAKPISFRGPVRCALIKFFYERKGDGRWYDYDQIKTSASLTSSTDTIGDAIEKINKRCGVEVIRFQTKSGHHLDHKEYRWM